MPRPPASPLPEDERPPDSGQASQPGSVPEKSRSSSKHMKKLKKQAKYDNLESQAPGAELTTKPKRHKKSSIDKLSSSAVYPSPDQAVCELVSDSKPSEPEGLPGEEVEPVKKKKKRSKDHQSKMEKSKSKKAATAAAAAAAVTATDAPITNEELRMAEVDSKVKSGNRSKERSKTNKDLANLGPNSSRGHKSHMSVVPSSEHEGRSRRMATGSSDTSLRHVSQEPEPQQCHSSRQSSHSSRFSSAHSSSYSRSPSHRIPEKRNDVRSYREKYRDRGAKYRTQERSRSPDLRQFQPRRTYVAYRPPSRGRDSSYEDYGHESRPPRMRHSRSRSHGMSRHSYETRDYDTPQPSSRLRDPSPRRTYSRRPYRDEPDRSRESPRRPMKRDRHAEERHTRRELSASDGRHARTYRPRERVHGDNFASPDNAGMPVHESRREMSHERSRHREPLRSVDGDRRMVRAEKVRVSPSRSSTRPSARSENRLREDKEHDRNQRESDTTKLERRGRRPTSSPVRRSTEHTTPIESETAIRASTKLHHKRSVSPKSPRATKRDSDPRKSHLSSTSSSSGKLRSMHEHLDQLQFEAISDVELESMLNPAVFLRSTRTKESFEAKALEAMVSEHRSNEARLLATGEDQSTNSAMAATSSLSTNTSNVNDVKSEESAALVLDTLDKISSQLRQKMAGPESWDTVTDSESEQEDELVLGGLDDLFTDHSVIGLTTCKPGWPSRSRQMTASLITPWQRLVESASKALDPVGGNAELETNDRECIQPAVCVGTPLNSRMNMFPCRLVPLQRRASGAACLAQVGVSARYLGSELTVELDRLVRDQLAADESGDSALLQSLTDGVASHPIAWMHRSRDTTTSYRQGWLRHWFESRVNFGVLSGKSDQLMRQVLLQEVN